MKDEHLSRQSGTGFALIASAILALLSLSVPRAAAQNPELQQRVAEVKQAAAQNKQALAHYSWRQPETIAIKDNFKDTKLYQVHVGPDGKP